MELKLQSAPSDWLDSLKDPRNHPDCLAPDVLVYQQHGLIVPLRPTGTKSYAVGELVGEGDPKPFVSFLEGLLKSGVADVIEFTDLYSEPLQVALRGARGASFLRDRRPTDRWFLDLTEQFWEGLPSGTRRTLKKRLRDFPGDFREYRTGADLADLTAQMAQVYPQAWQSRCRPSYYLSDPPLWAFLAQHNALRAYLLFQEGRPIAYHIGTLWNRNFIVVEIGYARGSAAQHPGMVLNCWVLQQLIKEAQTIDFGWGADGYKALFGNRRTQSVRAALVAKRLAPQFRARLAQTRLESRLLITSALRKLGVFSRIRGWLRA